MNSTQISEQLHSKLLAGLQQLRLPLSIAPSLLEYLGLLLRWNATYNLTAVRDPDEMLTKHLFDSLAIHSLVPNHRRLADLGSGAGLPGIPLAIAKPELQVTLIESNGKKARFLREVKRQLNLSNVRVIESRAEHVEESGQYDLITARALDRISGILQVGGHLLNADGHLLAMKGQIPPGVLDELPDHWVLQGIEQLVVPGLEAERHLMIIGRRPS